MRLRRVLAVCAAKMTEFISVRIFHRQGVTWAGLVALKICPSILKELAGQVKEEIFVVCGTNGKTTTNNMLCAALRAEGKRVICNHTGSNMINGVVAAFVLNAGLHGNLKADYACIEVDEASTRLIIPHFQPDYMVLTNLFRDQLDRYGEIDITMDILKSVMQQAPKMKVVVNGDDALSAFLVMESGNSYSTYGISEQVIKEQTNEIREGRFCKKCGASLSYSFYHYSQLGEYACTQCDFKRPEIQYDASAVEVSDHLAFTVEETRITANYKGFYNVYNVLAAYAAARSAGVLLPHFNQMLEKFNPENGRMESFRIRETSIILNLAKNPAGFNQNISAVMQDEKEKDIIIAINDLEQDGTDISWLWDVDFDRFKQANVNTITVSGIRSYDMQLRLKYADMIAQRYTDVEEAIRDRVEHGCQNLYLLVNYTALFSTRKVLKRLEEEK